LRIDGLRNFLFSGGVPKSQRSVFNFGLWVLFSQGFFLPQGVLQGKRFFFFIGRETILFNHEGPRTHLGSSLNFQSGDFFPAFSQSGWRGPFDGSESLSHGPRWRFSRQPVYGSFVFFAVGQLSYQICFFPSPPQPFFGKNPQPLFGDPPGAGYGDNFRPVPSVNPGPPVLWTSL